MNYGVNFVLIKVKYYYINVLLLFMIRSYIQADRPRLQGYVSIESAVSDISHWAVATRR
ncbi:hypothetical protein SFSGTM_30110 [Sulfuriferula nivalis]|uniref:Uncharacterized protein n=1 Tax=Sulfuriferula nivalis TaxID=2675298 RepID=A0A809SAX1_9PROT|nr:hypothetical protein SFSGTM_30110 [Sulfuriferula nivalis]